MPPEPVERLLSRPTLIVAACLAAAAGLAWLWLIRTAGAGDVMAMPMVADAWSADYLLSSFIMWLLMMVAMMLPSAAPMILFYARFARRSGMRGAGAATALFVSTYVGVWGLFSLAAAALQAALVSAGAVSAMALRFGDQRVAGALLLIAGLYQLSPLKRACLSGCRSPLDFLMRLWRPGTSGSLRLGAIHGLYCLGCCWPLMLLLFVGGVMNLIWVALLALIVAAEKLAPPWLRLDLVLAILLLVAGSAALAIPGTTGL